jgi:formate hydrogenlyase subunit 3/multisubunit Na+/H+ antiporter MnhD subunit
MLLLILLLLLVATVVSFISKKLSYILSAISSILLIYSSVTGKFDPITNYFMLVSAIVCLCTSVYSIGYDSYGSRLSSSFALIIASVVLILISRDALTFLVGWEGMTIASFIAMSSKKDSGKAAYTFLAFGELSTLLLIISFAMGIATTGSFYFQDWSSSPALIWILLTAILGFSIKAAIFPFHIWLPPAHSAAPSNMSSLLSSVLTLMGFYGIFRMLSVATPPLWISMMILVLGAITAAIGAMFAATSERVKELPSYSTIENDGIIFVAIGSYIVAVHYHNQYLAAFSIIAALFFAFSHSIAKATLFSVAGLVEKSAIKLTNLQKVKLSSMAVVAGYASALSLAAIPPFPGFVAEWMVLESLFQSFEIPNVESRVIVLLVGAVVALAAGISTVSMSKFISFGFHRDKREKKNCKYNTITDVGLAAFTFVLLLLGALPQLVLHFYSPVVELFSGISTARFIGGALSVPKGYLILSGKNFGCLSPSFVFVFLLSLISVLYALTYKKYRYRLTNPWNGGYSSGNYNSLAYSNILRLTLKRFYRVREEACRIVWSDFAETLYINSAMLMHDAMSIFRRCMMNGKLSAYLMYIILAVLVSLVYVRW